MLTGRLWHTYRSPSKRHFAQRLLQLREWAKCHTKQQSIHQRLESMRMKSKQFQVAYNYPNVAWTGNMVDRLVNYQDRLLKTMQYFHGSKDAARLYLRAMALIWNFIHMEREQCQKIQSGVLPSKISTGFSATKTGYRIFWLQVQWMLTGSDFHASQQNLQEQVTLEGFLLKVSSFIWVYSPDKAWTNYRLALEW